MQRHKVRQMTSRDFGKAGSDHSNRLHDRHRSSLGRPQLGCQLVLHYLCVVSTSIGRSWKMDRGQVLGTSHNVLLGYSHHMSSMDQRTRSVAAHICVNVPSADWLTAALIATRLLIGLFEAGFYPCCKLVLSQWSYGLAR